MPESTLSTEWKSKPHSENKYLWIVFSDNDQYSQYMKNEYSSEIEKKDTIQNGQRTWRESLKKYTSG